MSLAVRPVDAVMAAARAAAFTKRSIKEPAKSDGLRRAIAMVDLTTLEGQDTAQKVHALCRKAVRPCPTSLPDGIAKVPSVAAVCVYPSLVRIAKQSLGDAPIAVASVATAFPSGQAPLETRLEEVRRAVADGADEIDMVISRGRLLAGDESAVREEIAETRRACGPAHLKIILETGELGTLDRVRRASDLAIEAACTVPGLPVPADGEVFIKTSTGKVPKAATMPVSLVMMEAIRDAHRGGGPRIGFKPAGGIRTAKQALHYLVMLQETLGPAWMTPSLFRFGASSLLDDLVRQVLKAAFGGRYRAAWDVPTP